MNEHKNFELKVFAEDGVFYEGTCEELILPCVDGEKAFLPNHEHCVYAIYNGIMRYLIQEEKGSVWHEAVIGKGIFLFEKNSCMVLVETAERPEDIDEHRAQRALERAQEKMQKDLSMREYRISQMAMARATARIRAAARKKQD